MAYTRSQRPMSIGMSCSMIKIEQSRSSRMRRTRGANASASRWATPAVGSSSSSSRGSVATCAARSQMRRIPVDSSEVSASAHGPRPKASTISSARRDCPAPPNAPRAPRPWRAGEGLDPP